MKTYLVVGASRGLGRAFIEGLGDPGDVLVGVSRQRPDPMPERDGFDIQWIESDLNDPSGSADRIAEYFGARPIDVLICNVGVWERRAFEPDYAFSADDPQELARLVTTNITAPILLLRRILPTVLSAPRPRIVLTGSTSGLPRAGRPEVTFGATKFALSGIADALREGYRSQGLGVTTLQLGNLNTDDGLSIPREVAATRGHGTLIPVHDVVAVMRTLLDLSPSSYVRELVLPAIRDPRF